MRNRNLFISFLVLLVFAAQAQEALFPLGGNATLMQAWKKRQEQAKGAKGGNMQTQAVAAFLPFADDFSYFGPYPDPARWENATSVFVNHTKATKPITIGVATFDGLMANGYPYNASATSGTMFSDTLTSIPLRLDSLNGLSIIPSDSVTLRFYYQARGLWEKPDSGDDLFLDFYKPGQGVWQNIWFASGGFAPPDSLFKRKMIVITDTAYLKNGFKFRFRNSSQGSGDIDHWHLDAVYVDKKLNPNKDTIVPEISFSYDARSILKNYSQMPFNQFMGAADMLSNFDVYNNLRNNYTTGVNLTTYYQINDNAGNNVAQNTNGTNNVLPFGSGGYCPDASLVNPSLNSFAYNTGPFADSTSYFLKFYATNISDNYHENDTIYYRQNFHNYFAYDDGSAEAGYGFTANNGLTAVRYKLNVPDTLRAIDIFFDPITNVSLLQNAAIKVRVWSDNGGIPGTMYADSALWGFPVFSQNGFNVFQRYELVSPITFTTAATFYIGVWQQLNLSLNIGYDLNNDSRTNVFFNTGSGWSNSSFKGSLMMHPVFGDSLRAVGVETHAGLAQEKVLLYPNPATDEVLVSAKNKVNKIILCDLLGNTLLEESGTRINISTLPNGMYLVRTYTATGYCDIQKLLIAR